MSARLEIEDVDSMDALPLTDGSLFLSLTLEREDTETAYAHGAISLSPDGPAFPIRSNRPMYEALRAYLGDASEQD